jgi:hypothetical protein
MTVPIARRNFVVALAGAAAAWPLAVRAQQGVRGRRIGVLLPGNENDPVYTPRLSAFTQALAGLGWTDGRNVRMDLRWGGLDVNRIRALAQEFVGLQTDIIVTDGTSAIVTTRARASNSWWGQTPAAAMTSMRAVARHLPSHIPGKPTITVKNMPGAGTGAKWRSRNSQRSARDTQSTRERAVLAPIEDVMKLIGISS